MDEAGLLEVLGPVAAERVLLDPASAELFFTAPANVSGALPGSPADGAGRFFTLADWQVPPRVCHLSAATSPLSPHPTSPLPPHRCLRPVGPPVRRRRGLHLHVGARMMLDYFSICIHILQVCDLHESVLARALGPQAREVEPVPSRRR